MKKLIFITIFLFIQFCFYSFVNGQSKDSLKHKNELRIGLLQMRNYTLHINYERHFDDKKSLVGLVQTPSLLSFGSREFSTFYGVSYKYNLINFIKDKEYSINWNTYFSPGLRYYIYQYKDSQYRDIIDSYEGNIVVGFNNIKSSKNAVIDFNVGIAYRYSIISTNRENPNFGYRFLYPGYTGIAPIANLTIGVKF